MIEKSLLFVLSSLLFSALILGVGLVLIYSESSPSIVFVQQDLPLTLSAMMSVSGNATLLYTLIDNRNDYDFTVQGSTLLLTFNKKVPSLIPKPLFFILNKAYQFQIEEKPNLMIIKKGNHEQTR